jgi:pyrroloquinoline quinone (PQQ) biosynthesis protein C
VDIEHQKTWKRMLAKHAQTKQQRKRAQKALNESLKSLWHLLDGVYSLHYQKQK